MAIRTDGKVHCIRCDICGLEEVNATVPWSCFVDAMKHLAWEFFQCEDGTFDSICPDCMKKRRQPGEIKILEGR